MRKIIFGAFLIGLTPACLLLSPLDEATPDNGYAGSGGSVSSGGKGSGGSAGKGSAGSVSTGGSSSGGSGGGAPPAAHTCSDPLMIDDMEAPSHTTNICQSNRTGGWYVYSDGTGTSNPPATPDGGPPFPYTALDTPRGSSTYAAHVSGSGFTTYGGGMGVGMNYPDAPYDVSAYAGIQFWAKGTGMIRVDMSTMQTQDVAYGGECVPGALDCGDHYGKFITLGSSWQQYTVKFGEVTQQGWGVPAVNFWLDRLLGLNFTWPTGVSFDIWIDDLRFLESDCDSAVYTDSCPSASTYQTCWYNSATTFNCSSYCPLIGFTTASTCSVGDSGALCDCPEPARLDCYYGAVFICDCYEATATPCVPGELAQYYQGCYRGAPGYDAVSCTDTYALDPADPGFATACADAQAACLNTAN